MATCTQNSSGSFLPFCSSNNNSGYHQQRCLSPTRGSSLISPSSVLCKSPSCVRTGVQNSSVFRFVLDSPIYKQQYGETKKRSSSKRMCACSPATHPGSFRCSLHRTPWRAVVVVNGEFFGENRIRGGRVGAAGTRSPHPAVFTPSETQSSVQVQAQQALSHVQGLVTSYLSLSLSNALTISLSLDMTQM
ncbi:hypothetical protein AMTRI_Chr13g88880 [Amborella trichopoda]